MHFNCRILNGTVLLQSSTTSCCLHTWKQTNSSNKFAANFNMKGISFFFTHPERKYMNIHPLNKSASYAPGYTTIFSLLLPFMVKDVHHRKKLSYIAILTIKSI